MKFTKLVKANEDNLISIEENGTLFSGIIEDQGYVFDMAKYLQKFAEDCDKVLGFINKIKGMSNNDERDWHNNLQTAKLQAIELLKTLRKNYFDII